MDIIIADSSDKQRWDQYVSSHPNGIAYHFFAWKEAVEEAYGFRGYYLIAENKKRIQGVLPLMHVKPPFMPGGLVSLPYCDAGGPLADSKAIEGVLLSRAIEMTAQKNFKKMSIRSINAFEGFNGGNRLQRSKVRMVLNLPGNSAQLMTSFKAKLRSQIRKPVRDGLTTQIGGVELLDSFYPLFAENMHHLGSPVHSFKWIKSILLNYGNRASLVIVRMADKTPAAGGIILCHPNQVAVPWASSLRHLNRWNSNMLLYWTLLKFACDMGYPSFDFGRSTLGEGTFKFKSQWGAKPLPLFWIAFPGKKEKICKNIPENEKRSFRQLAGLYWSLLPISATRYAGPLLRRYIDL